MFLWPFEDFGTTFVYVIVRRFVFDCGVSFVFGVSFIDFGDSSLLGGVFYRFSLRSPHLSFVCCYFKTPSLAFLVLVRIHCNFNKFHFRFLKKKNCNDGTNTIRKIPLNNIELIGQSQFIFTTLFLVLL